MPISMSGLFRQRLGHGCVYLGATPLCQEPDDSKTKEPISLKADLVESQKPCLPSYTRESANERLGYKRRTASLPDGQHGHNKRKS